MVLRGQRRQRSSNNHRIAKRESSIDSDEEGIDIEADIVENENEERYFLLQILQLTGHLKVTLSLGL